MLLLQKDLFVWNLLLNGPLCVKELKGTLHSFEYWTLQNTSYPTVMMVSFFWESTRWQQNHCFHRHHFDVTSLTDRLVTQTNISEHLLKKMTQECHLRGSNWPCLLSGTKFEFGSKNLDFGKFVPTRAGVSFPGLQALQLRPVETGTSGGNESPLGDLHNPGDQCSPDASK